MPLLMLIEVAANTPPIVRSKQTVSEKKSLFRRFLFSARTISP